MNNEYVRSDHKLNELFWFGNPGNFHFRCHHLIDSSSKVPAGLAQPVSLVLC